MDAAPTRRRRATGAGGEQDPLSSRTAPAADGRVPTTTPPTEPREEEEKTTTTPLFTEEHLDETAASMAEDWVFESECQAVIAAKGLRNAEAEVRRARSTLMMP